MLAFILPETQMTSVDVRFANRSFRLADVLEYPARYVRELEQARNRVGWAECLCTSHEKPLRLVIRRYGSMYHLAGWPEDGHRHLRGVCPFHKDAAAPGSKAAPADAAIRKTAQGLNVRLDASFAPAQLSPAAKPRLAGEPEQAARKSRRSASLLGFLQSLWVEAGLNVWPKGASGRNWGFCNTVLAEAIGEGPINGQQADRVMHVMRRFEEANAREINDELDAFIAALQPAGEKQLSRRGLILGEINTVEPTKFGHSITLRQNRRRYFCDKRLIERATTSYRFAWPAIGQSQARVVALLLVEMHNGYARVIDLCAMLCSTGFLPCDSMFEVSMANRLTKESRAFEKPLSPNSDDILADFVLLDTPQHVEIEVYGLNGQADYEQRKREKQLIRARRGVQCVEWNTDREPLSAVLLPPSL